MTRREFITLLGGGRLAARGTRAAAREDAADWRAREYQHSAGA